MVMMTPEFVYLPTLQHRHRDLTGLGAYHTRLAQHVSDTVLPAQFASEFVLPARHISDLYALYSVLLAQHVITC